MDTNVFITKLDALMTSAKNNKKSGTQLALRLFLSNGETPRFIQYPNSAETQSSFYKYDLDETNETLQIGNKATVDEEISTGIASNSYSIFAISDIIGFTIEFVKEVTNSSSSSSN